MTLDQIPRVSSGWLRLREPADATARSAELAALVAPEDPAVIWDLGSGTGSMGRWLAPLLPVKQHWVLCDRDDELLEQACLEAASVEATVETRRCDVTRLTADDLRGAGLVTCSALLDLLTAQEIDRIAAACVGAQCPALLTLTVIGRVELTPAHPLDAHFEAAFNAHQRRRSKSGPDAVDAVVEAFTRRGAATLLRPSPWRLEPGELLAEWLAGWVGAACEQQPDLAGLAGPYLREREAPLSAVIHHSDLLANWE